MREVAVALRVDLNTVRRAYEALERLGVVVLARGRGSFVAERPPTPQPDGARLDQAAYRALAGFAAAGAGPGGGPPIAFSPSPPARASVPEGSS